MSARPLVRLNRDFYDETKHAAALAQRSVADQIEFWARLGQAALGTADFERLLDCVEDMEDALLVKERGNGPFIEVSLDEL